MDPGAARPLLERAVAIGETAYGPDHPQLLTPINNLATALSQLGDPAAARPLLERAVAIGETVEQARRQLGAAVAAVNAADPWLRENPVQVEWFGGQFASGNEARHTDRREVGNGRKMTAVQLQWEYFHRAGHNFAICAMVTLRSASCWRRCMTDSWRAPRAIRGPGWCPG